MSAFTFLVKRGRLFLHGYNIIFVLCYHILSLPISRTAVSFVIVE